MEANRPEIKKEKWKIIIGYGILLMILMTGILRNRTLFRDVIKQLRQIPPAHILVQFLISVFYWSMDGYILYFLGRRYNRTLSILNGIHATFCGSFFRVATFGNGMGIAKVYYLTQDGVPVGNSMGVCLLQTIFYRIAVWLLGIIPLICSVSTRSAIRPYWKIVTIGILLNIVVLIFLVTISIAQNFTGMLFKYANFLVKNKANWIKWLDKAQIQVSLLQRETEKIYKEKRAAFQLLALSILQQLVLYLLPYFGSGDTSISFLQIFMATAVAHMLAGVIPMPSGFGSLEFVFSIMFANIAKKASAISAIVMFRFMFTFVPFFIGAFPVFRWKAPRKLKPES